MRSIPTGGSDLLGEGIRSDNPEFLCYGNFLKAQIIIILYKYT